MNDFCSFFATKIIKTTSVLKSENFVIVPTDEPSHSLTLVEGNEEVCDVDDTKEVNPPFSADVEHQQTGQQYSENCQMQSNSFHKPVVISISLIVTQ